MAKCSKCGADVPHDADACPTCGAAALSVQRAAHGLGAAAFWLIVHEITLRYRLRQMKAEEVASVFSGAKRSTQAMGALVSEADRQAIEFALSMLDTAERTILAADVEKPPGSPN
jgi:hypothetical protein